VSNFYDDEVRWSLAQDRAARPQAGDPVVTCARCLSLGRAQLSPVVDAGPLLELTADGWRWLGKYTRLCLACLYWRRAQAELLEQQRGKA